MSYVRILLEATDFVQKVNTYIRFMTSDQTSYFRLFPEKLTTLPAPME
jgi:hypothetical protein